LFDIKEENKKQGEKTMSKQQSPLTYEGVLELFRLTRKQMRKDSRAMRRVSEETDRKIQEMSAETDRKIQEVTERIEKTTAQLEKTAVQMEKTDKIISELGSRIGEIVENMVGGGNIVKQFQALNIAIHAHSRDKTFGTRGTSESGEIDVFLENGDLVILIEVKTKPTQDDVREHIERLKKYRLYGNDKRRILGAIAGAVVPDKVAEFSHKKGMYVIVQSGEAVEIIAQPEGFMAKEW